MDLRAKLRVRAAAKVDLARIDPDASPGVHGKEAAQVALSETLARLRELQYVMYAENRRALLVVLQAMDSGGKDGTIRSVMAGLNPQGCEVTSFKVPSDEERDHDYLWRIHKAVPRRGNFGIFNRSHYEEVLVVRVHELVAESVWRKRYDEINAFEKLM